jgi:hypothetical protein
MNHAFDDITPEGLIVAIQCLMTAPHDGKEQAIMLQTAANGDFVMTLGDRNKSDPATGKPRNQRVLSSPDFAHLIWSALNENHEALSGFKKLTGWENTGGKTRGQAGA